MSRFARGGGSAKGVEEIREVGVILRDQMNLLRSIKEEEDDLDMLVDDIESTIEELDALKNSRRKKVTLDTNFLTKCYKSVVFATEGARIKLLQIGRILIGQRMVKNPSPYVTQNMEYDFITAWQICLQQHVRVIKQMRLSINISVLDSISQIADVVNKYLAPAYMRKEKELERNAMRKRNKMLYGAEDEYE
jgi:hypothetical protein